MQLPGDGLRLGSDKYSNARPVARAATFKGLAVSVEFDVGDVHQGDGWRVVYRHPYGEIPSSRTLADGEGVDVYLGPDESSDTVFVVHQVSQDGRYDEDKAMLGFPDEASAVACYRDHGPEWGFGGVDAMTWREFVHGYLASNRQVQGRAA